jgi:hypothetical protein
VCSGLSFNPRESRCHADVWVEFWWVGLEEEWPKRGR